MDGDGARFQEPVGHVDAVTAPEPASPATVRDAFIAFDDHGEIALKELVGHVGEAWPQGVTVSTVAERTARNAAKADLEQLEPLALAIIAREHQVRRRGEASGAEEFGGLLAQQRAQNVEDPAQSVGAAGQGGRELRLQQ